MTCGNSIQGQDLDLGQWRGFYQCVRSVWNHGHSLRRQCTRRPFLRPLTDAAGNLWPPGGSGFDSTGASGEDLLNDLWEYSPSTNAWTWINGVDGVDAAGIYGTKGTAAATNQPGARYFAGAWADHSGNFWLFGGMGYSSTGEY